MIYRAARPAAGADDEKLLEWLGISRTPKKVLSEVTYFTCLKMLSETLAKMPIKFYQQTDRGVEEAETNKAYELLKTRPNPQMTPSTFWATVENNRNHYGNAYVWIRREFNRMMYGGEIEIKDLWIMPSADTTIVIDDKGVFGDSGDIYYWYTDKYSGESYIFPSGDVLHFKTSMTFDGYSGAPVREILKATIEGGLESQNFLNNLYKGGLTARAVLQYALETLVNVEPVKTLSGSRVIERYADQTPFDNIDEAAEFPDVSTPQFEKVDYKVKKKGGILKITQELLDDTAENIISYLKKWIAKKAKATRNFLIVAKIREITTDAEVAVDSLDDLKKIFNVLLDPAIALTAGVVTNQDGYNWLDSLKDKDGKYILQPDPTKPTSTLLFGKYPVKKVSNRTMPSKTTDGGYKVPIVCGDLKEAITIFDRETLTIDISSSAGKLWETDQTGIKVRERLDIKAIDEEAIVMAEHTIKTTTDVQQTAAQSATEETKTYTQAEIEKMSRENIIALGTQLGYTMTTTASDEKSAVVADFMAQQTAAQNK